MSKIKNSLIDIYADEWDSYLEGSREENQNVGCQ